MTALYEIHKKIEYQQSVNLFDTLLTIEDIKATAAGKGTIPEKTKKVQELIKKYINKYEN